MNFSAFHLYANLWATMAQPIADGVAPIIQALVNYVTGPFRAWVLVYLIGTALMAAYSPSDDAAMKFFRHLFRASFCYFAISTAAQFNAFFGNVFLHTLPTGIANAIAGTGSATATLDSNAFDKLTVQAFQAGIAIMKSLPKYSLMSIPLAFVVVLYWFAAAISILVLFGVYFVAFIFIALLVAVGVLFVALWFFPETRRFFLGWISAMLYAVLLQVFSIVLLSFTFKTVSLQILQIGAYGAGVNDADQYTGILSMIDIMLIFGASVYVAYRLGDVCSTIVGGGYAQVGHMVSSVQNAFSGLGGGGGEAATTNANSGQSGAGGEQPAQQYSFQRTVGSAP